MFKIQIFFKINGLSFRPYFSTKSLHFYQLEIPRYVSHENYHTLADSEDPGGFQCKLSGKYTRIKRSFSHSSLYFTVLTEVLWRLIYDQLRYNTVINFVTLKTGFSGQTGREKKAAFWPIARVLTRDTQSDFVFQLSLYKKIFLQKNTFEVKIKQK